MAKRKLVASGLALCLAISLQLVSLKSGEAAEPGKTPAFSTTVSQSDGFSFAITNYDSTFSWQFTTTAGKLSFQAGVLKVTGLAAGQSATVTVTSSKPGFENGMSTVTSAALTPVAPTPSPSSTPTPTSTPTPSPSQTTSGINPALNPSFSTTVSTETGFTFSITNYDPNFSWNVSATAGKSSITGSVISISELGPGQTSSVTVTASRNGYSTGSNTVSGSAKVATVATPVPTSSISSPTSPLPSPQVIASATPTSLATPSQSGSTGVSTPIPSVSPTNVVSTTPSNTTTPKVTSSPTTSASPNPTQSALPSKSPVSGITSNPSSSAMPTKSASAPTKSVASVGEAAVVARPPLTNGAKVIVPILISANAPKLNKNAKSPVANLKVGGLNKAQAKVIPTVIVEVSKRPIEVQFAANLPTSIVVIGFKPKAKVEIEIGNFGKKRTSLGDANANASGSVVLSPITFTKSGESYMLYLNSKANKVSMRVRS